MIYESSKAYSFPKKNKKTENNFVNQAQLITPHIGQYNKNILTTPSKGAHFPKEQRMKLPRSNTPGPGKYNGSQEGRFGKEGPKYKMGSETKDSVVAQMINKKKRTPTPGPGEYPVDNNKMDSTIRKRVIVTKFSKGKKDINYDNKKPGPSSYNIPEPFGKTAGQASMGKSKRDCILEAKQSDQEKEMGPGKYVLKEEFGNSGTKTTLRGKPNTNIRSKTPGPGYYYFEDSKKKLLIKSPSFSIGTMKRPDHLGITKSNPKMGPGQYVYCQTDFNVTDRNRIRAKSFAKEKRMNGKINNTPGPGKYKIPCSIGNVAPVGQLTQNEQFKYV